MASGGDLQTLLLILGNDLRKKDLSIIKFKCGIPLGRQEDIESHTDLWNYFLGIGNIDLNDEVVTIEFLKMILDPINFGGNIRLINHVLSYCQEPEMTSQCSLGTDSGPSSSLSSVNMESDPDDDFKPIIDVPEVLQTARTKGETRDNYHSIDFVYKRATPESLHRNFPKLILTKNLEETVTFGRDNTDEELDVLILNERISRKHVSISFDNNKQQFKIRNIGSRDVFVFGASGKTKLKPNKGCPLHEKNKIYFDLREEKLCFIVSINMNTTSKEIKGFCAEVYCEPDADDEQ